MNAIQLKNGQKIIEIEIDHKKEQYSKQRNR